MKTSSSFHIMTTAEFDEKYKSALSRTHFQDFYRDAENVAVSVGYQYMKGDVTVLEVQEFLRTTGNGWPFDGFTESMILVSKGIKQAIDDGVSLPSRIQPVQDEYTLRQCKKKRGKRK